MNSVVPVFFRHLIIKYFKFLQFLLAFLVRVLIKSSVFKSREIEDLSLALELNTLLYTIILQIYQFEITFASFYIYIKNYCLSSHETVYA